MWRVQKTENFGKWWRKERVDDGNWRYHEAALREFQNVSLPHNVQSCLFRNASFQCWVTRLPDKMRRQGKSHGFRVVLVLDLEEKILLLQGIFRRSNLDFQGQSGRHQDAYDALVKAVAQEFIQPG